MSHAQPQGYQYSMPCVEETSIWMFIPNVMHACVDCLWKWVRRKLNVEVLLFPTVFSVIDRIKASCHWFCACCPCKANHISSYLLLSPMMAAAAIWNAVATPKNLPKLTLPFLMESKYHGFHMDTRPPEGQFFLLLPHLGILWDPRMAVKGVSNHPTNILSLIPLWS